MATEELIDSAIRYERDKGKKPLSDPHRGDYVHMLYDRESELWDQAQENATATLVRCHVKHGFIKDLEELELFAEMLGLEDRLE